jgi:hypothetical protein
MKGPIPPMSRVSLRIETQFNPPAIGYHFPGEICYCCGPVGLFPRSGREPITYTVAATNMPFLMDPSTRTISPV